MVQGEFAMSFFNQIENLPIAEIGEKIDEVGKLARTFQKDSEAYHDARFILKHLRRTRLEKAFSEPLAA